MLLMSKQCSKHWISSSTADAVRLTNYSIHSKPIIHNSILPSRLQRTRIDRHSNDCVNVHGVELADFIHALDTPGDNEMFLGRLAQVARDVHGEAAHHSFEIDVCVEEGVAIRFEQLDGVFWSDIDRLSPPLGDDFPRTRIDGEHEFFRA